jgi:hypothetical protein
MKMTSSIPPAHRVHGRERLREEELYNLTRIVSEALDEADYLARKVNGKVYSRVSDHDGSKGTASPDLDLRGIGELLAEAHQCAGVAIEYLRQARDRVLPPEPPF